MEMVNPVVIEAEFDGEHFVPRQPVDLPAGQRVILYLLPESGKKPLSREERLQRYWQMIERFRRNPVDVALTDEQLRREHIYDNE